MSKNASKTEALAGILAAWIRGRKLEPHAKLPSEKDLIAKYGVSLPTVQSALDALEKRGLLYRKPKSGTYVSPPVRRGRLLVVIQEPFATRLASSGFSQNMERTFFLSLVQESLTGPDPLEPVLLPWTSGFEKVLPDLEIVYPDLAGVVFLRAHEPLLLAKETLEAKGIPYLFYGSSARRSETGEVPARLWNEVHLARLALQHLEKRGHRKIGVAGNPGFPAHAARMAVCREWSTHRGRTEGPVLECLVANVEELFPLRQGAVPAPAWIACDDDFAALLLQSALRSGYRVPDDLEIVSIGTSALSVYLRPMLTTVSIPFAEDAAAIYRIFVARPERLPVIPQFTEPVLAERDSTKPLPKAK